MKKYDEIKENVWDIKCLTLKTYMAFIKLKNCGTCNVVWSNDENGWEHVSVSPKKTMNVPTWEDMCKLKDIFFYDEEEVYQIHPPKSQYVNITENCLHLWRLNNGVKLDMCKDLKVVLDIKNGEYNE